MGKNNKIRVMNRRKNIMIGMVKTIAFSIFIPLAAIFALRYRIESMQERLLLKTDYYALLEACRDVMRMVDKGDLKSNRRYDIRGNKSSPEVSRLPRAILDLSPRDIYVKSGRVQNFAPKNISIDYRLIKLEMHGSIAHFGVFAYPEDFNEPFEDYKYGHRELIKGLWYYDDKFNEENPNPSYIKKIDAMIEKGKARQREQSIH